MHYNEPIRHRQYRHHPPGHAGSTSTGRKKNIARSWQMGAATMTRTKTPATSRHTARRTLSLTGQSGNTLQIYECRSSIVSIQELSTRVKINCRQLHKNKVHARNRFHSGRHLSTGLSWDLSALAGRRVK